MALAHPGLVAVTCLEGMTRSAPGRLDGRFNAFAPRGAISVLFLPVRAPSRGDRPASGDGATGSLPYSTFLGWSADGRVVAQITWARDCEHTVRGGVYLVDPRTLKRTYVTRWAWTMWNAFPDPPVALRCPVGERLNGYRAVANGSRSCPRY